MNCRSYLVCASKRSIDIYLKKINIVFGIEGRDFTRFRVANHVNNNNKMILNYESEKTCGECRWRFLEIDGAGWSSSDFKIVRLGPAWSRDPFFRWPHNSEILANFGWESKRWLWPSFAHSTLVFLLFFIEYTMKTSTLGHVHCMRKVSPSTVSMNNK